MQKIKKYFKFLYNNFFISPNVAVIMYHRIFNARGELLGPNEYTVNPNTFEQHLNFFQNNYNIISSEELYNGIKEKNKTLNKSIVITFDDGFKDTYTKALPILEKYEIPATVFVSVNLIEEDNPIEFELTEIIKSNSRLKINYANIEKNYELKDINSKRKCYQDLKGIVKHKKPKFRKKFLQSLRKQNDINLKNKDNLIMDWNKCKELSKHPLITIGSHGMHHVPLTVFQSKSNQLKEIKKSKTELENKLNCQINLFSYPYGSFNNEIIDACKKSKYKMAFSTQPRLIHKEKSKGLFTLPRLEAPTTSLQETNKVKVKLDKLK